ncbi:hypothetical protein [Kitasatospora sp. NPDC001683]
MSVLLLTAFIGWIAYGWWDVRQPANMPMREGVLKLDGMLEATTAGVEPPVRMAYGPIVGKQYDTGLNDDVDKHHISETGQIVTRISPSKAVELSDKIEARWKQLGYRTTRSTQAAPPVKATTIDGSEIQLDISSDGRATVRISLGPYVHLSPFTRPSGAPTESPAEAPTMAEDPYWSH